MGKGAFIAIFAVSVKFETLAHLSPEFMDMWSRWSKIVIDDWQGGFCHWSSSWSFCFLRLEVGIDIQQGSFFLFFTFVAAYRNVHTANIELFRLLIDMKLLLLSCYSMTHIRSCGIGNGATSGRASRTSLISGFDFTTFGACFK